ncbi:MAG: Methyltransferase type 11, partial [Paenibacillus sp.]|nr:Methyltransferase type 11 [Paenibacillus sp.]
MNEIDYKGFYDQVGAINGWDFSKVNCLSEGVAWDYGSEVTRACTGTEALLDIGTGGGEQLLKIAGFVRQAVGIDNSAAMIETARGNGRKANQPDVAFLEMDAEALDFPDRSFQIVICRQAPFEAKEVARVLADDGVFITQQVGGRDKINLIEAFGRG